MENKLSSIEQKLDALLESIEKEDPLSTREKNQVDQGKSRASSDARR